MIWHKLNHCYKGKFHNLFHGFASSLINFQMGNDQNLSFNSLCFTSKSTPSVGFCPPSSHLTNPRAWIWKRYFPKKAANQQYRRANIKTKHLLTKIHTRNLTLIPQHPCMVYLSTQIWAKCRLNMVKCFEKSFPPNAPLYSWAALTELASKHSVCSRAWPSDFLW